MTRLVLALILAAAAFDALTGWYVMKGTHTAAGPYDLATCERVSTQVPGSNGCQWHTRPQ